MCFFTYLCYIFMLSEDDKQIYKEAICVKSGNFAKINTKNMLLVVCIAACMRSAANVVLSHKLLCMTKKQEQLWVILNIIYKPQSFYITRDTTLTLYHFTFITYSNFNQYYQYEFLPEYTDRPTYLKSSKI